MDFTGNFPRTIQDEGKAGIIQLFSKQGNNGCRPCRKAPLSSFLIFFPKGDDNGNALVSLCLLIRIRNLPVKCRTIFADECFRFSALVNDFDGRKLLVCHPNVTQSQSSGL